MPTENRAGLPETFYAEVAEATIQRATGIHPHLAKAILECAIPRWLDLELTTALQPAAAPEGLSAEAILRYLQALHLVQPHPAGSGRWMLLPDLRTALLARPAVQHNWLVLQARAAAVFRQRLDAHPASGEGRFRDTGWRDLAVEWVYHLLHQDPVAGWHQVQLICAQAFAIPTYGARWEVDFCVQFLSGLTWPPGIDELDTHMAALKGGFADLAAYRDVQALPVIDGLAAVPGLTAVEESSIRAWVGSVCLHDAGNLDMALKRLHEAEALTPADASIQFDLSEAYRMPGIWAGRYDLAEQHARQALAVAPESDVGCLAMGYLAQALKEWQQAEVWFRQAVDANPDAIDGYLGLSEVAAARRQLDEALAQIDAATAVNPGIRYYALIRRGNALRDARRDAAALHEYDLARREAHDRVDAYIASGDIHFSQGRHAEAEALYQQALHEVPNDPNSLIALATLYAEDDPNRATALLEEALTAGVRTKGVYDALNDLYRNEGKIPEVARVRQVLVQLDPQEAYTGDCTMGRVFLDAAWRQPAMTGRAPLLDKAEDAFLAALARDAQRAWAYVGLAEIAVLRNDSPTVQDNLQRLQKMAPWAEYDGLVLIALAYKDVYAAPAAATLLHTATGLKPDRTAAWQALADLRAWEGDPAGVEQAWAHVARIDPAQAYEAHVAVGDIYQNVGDDHRARDEYTAAAELLPEHTVAILRLAELDEASGRVSDAAEGYRRAAELAPNQLALTAGRMSRLLLREGNNADAERAAREAIAANPRLLVGYVELASIGVALGRDDLITEARRKLLAAVGDRLTYDFDYAVGETYREAGFFADARAKFATCMAQDQARVDAYVGMGLAWLAEGELARAQHVLNQALALDDTQVDVHNAFSQLYSAQGHVAGVRTAQARVVALQPVLQYDAYLAIGAAYEAAQQYSQAQVEYQTAIDLAPWRPDAYASLAVLLRRAERPREAEQAYRQARELAGIAYADLAWYYQQRGQLADAEEVYRLGIAEESTQLATYTGLVDLLVTDGRVAAALDVLDDMARHPELACEAQLVRARWLAQEQHDDEAVMAYRDTIAVFPNRPEAYRELAHLYIEQNNLHGARNILRQGIKAIPGDVLFVYLLAQLASELRQDDEARKYYLKAGKLDPNDADASVAYQRAAEIALRQGELPAAHRALQMAIKRNPDNASAHFMLGQLLEHQNRLPQAAAAYARATAIAPKYAEAYGARGRIYGRLGDMASLDAMTQEVLALNPDEAYAATIVVAHAYRQASDYRRAEESYRQAINLQSEQPEAMLYLASLLERQQRLVESAQLYQQAAKRLTDPPASADAWGQAGRVLVQMAQYPTAEAAFAAGRAADPDNAALAVALGDLYERTGDLEQAAVHYDRARMLDPNTTHIYVSLGRVAGLQSKPQKLAWVIRHVRRLALIPEYEYDRLLLIGEVYQAAGDTKRAEATYREILSAYPDRPEAYWNLIRLLVELARLPDALTVAEIMTRQPQLSAVAWSAIAQLKVQLDDPAAAEDAYRRAIAFDPANGTWYLELATFYETNNRPADLEAVLRQGIKAAPGDVDLLLAEAARLTAQGQRNAAIGRLQTAAGLTREPADVSTIYGRIGELWLQEGHPDRAESEWRRALEQDPENAGVTLNLGRLHERAGRMEKALEMYTRATLLAPKFRDAYAARGHILAAQGDVAGIGQMARELASLFLDAEETYQAHLLVASTYAEAGFYDAATRELGAAVAIDADNPEAHIQLGWVYEVQQQWSKARAEYELVGKLVPELQRNVALRVGQLFANEGNPGAAVEAFQKGIDLAPHEPDGYLSLARFYETQQQPDKAGATYRRMMGWGPAMESLAHQALGAMAERQGDTTGAEAAYLQALAVSPQDAGTHMLLAGLYEATSQWDKAIEAYQQTAEADPSQATNALLFMADIHRRLGRLEALHATCARVIALVDGMASPDSDALRQRGLAYAMQGDHLHAAEGLRQALVANPQDFQAHFYLAVTLTVLGHSAEAQTHLAQGIRLTQRRADFVYALREAEVLAEHEPPIAGADALLEQLRAARDRWP